MRITLLICLLMSQVAFANHFTLDEYAGVKLGSHGDKALELLKNYHPEKSSYDEAQSCFYLIPPADFDGAYIMVLDGTVERFEVDEQSSKITTQEGIGIGSSKADVVGAYKDVKVSVHPYLGEAGEYLEVTLDNGNGLIFETYQDKVSSFRLGRYPAVLFIEGCA
ncbi:hypothetical protein [Aliiglaciecola aliphaticivorans]